MLISKVYISKILLLCYCLQFFLSAFFYPHFSIRIFPSASATRIRHPQVSGPRFTDTSRHRTGKKAPLQFGLRTKFAILAGRGR